MIVQSVLEMYTIVISSTNVLMMSIVNLVVIWRLCVFGNSHFWIVTS